MSVTFDLQKPVTPNVGGPLRSPSLLVIHGTASGTLQGSVDWLKNKRAKASAHFVVGRDGQIVQLVPLTTVAWHAGSSTWRGRAGCNSFSLGIELVNWGMLKRNDEDGSFSTVMNARIQLDPSEVIETPVPGIAVRFWQTYTAQQIETLDSLIGELFEHMPSLQEIAGHSEVSPRRKVDPYPSFDGHMAALKKKHDRLAASGS